jgi:hypothetical protein
MLTRFTAGNAHSVLIGPIVQVVHFKAAGIAETVTIGVVAVQQHATKVMAAGGADQHVRLIALADCLMASFMFALFAAVGANAIVVAPVVEQFVVASIAEAVIIVVALTFDVHQTAVQAFEAMTTILVADIDYIILSMLALSAAAASANAVLIGPVVGMEFILAQVADEVAVLVGAVPFNGDHITAYTAAPAVLGGVSVGTFDVLIHIVIFGMGMESAATVSAETGVFFIVPIVRQRSAVGFTAGFTNRLLGAGSFTAVMRCCFTIRLTASFTDCGACAGRFSACMI